MMWTWSWKEMMSWIFMMMHLSLHIGKQVKFQLDYHLRKRTMLCIRPNNLNEEVIPSYECG